MYASANLYYDINSEVIAIFNKIIPDTLSKFFYENKELHEY